MIDRLKVGEIAESEGHKWRVKRFKGGIIYVNDCGEIRGGKGKRIPHFELNSDRVLGEKWRILPQYISFEEAMEESKKGKTVRLHNKRLGDVVLDDEQACFELKHHEISDYSLRELINGNWSVE